MNAGEESRWRDGGRYGVLWVRTAVGLSMVLSAVAKVVSVFLGGELQVVGVSGAPALTVGVVVGSLELAAAAFLLLGRVRLGAWMGFVLGCSFGVVSAAVIGLGYPLRDCGCFGAYSIPVSAHLALVLGLIFGSRYLLCEES